MTHEEIIALAKEAGLPYLPTPNSALVRIVTKAVLIEREACAQVCSDKALRCEAEAQRAIDNGEHDEISAIRSAAWQISICATAIRQRGAA